MKVSITNSLSSRHPELAAQWHPTKNGPLIPSQVVAGSAQKAWWSCSVAPDHEWEAVINSRVRGNGCPCCDGRKASVTNSLASLFPEIAKEFHSTKNGAITPENIVAYSGKKYWWKCLQGGDHEWETTVSQRTSSGTGCPYCAGQKVSTTNSLLGVNSELLREWHPVRNGQLTTENVTAGSGKKVWWLCPVAADHEWQASPHSRLKGSGCPYCAGRKVSKTNSLASLCPELIQQWHPTKNGLITPEQVVAGSHRKAWWQCSETPEHEWEAVIKSRANGNGCPLCSNQTVSSTNSLAAKYPDLAQQWHPTKNGDLTPAQIVAGSNRMAWWVCPKSPDHEWEAVVYNVPHKLHRGIR